MTLKLTEKPVVFLDVETTGPNPEADRIVQLAMLDVTPNGTVREWNRYLNPGEPIPPEATDVHGITDERVRHEKRFAEIAGDLYIFLEKRVLVAYNGRFDFTVLRQEFARAGMNWSSDDHQVLDPYRWLFKLAPRDLGSIYEHYTGQPMEGAHNAMRDVSALSELVNRMIAEHGLPDTVDGLVEHFREEDEGRYADPRGRKFEWRFREPVFAFGTHRGKPIYKVNRDYLEWMLRDSAGFGKDTRQLVKTFLETGVIPQREVKSDDDGAQRGDKPGSGDAGVQRGEGQGLAPGREDAGHVSGGGTGPEADRTGRTDGAVAEPDSAKV